MKQFLKIKNVSVKKKLIKLSMTFKGPIKRAESVILVMKNAKNVKKNHIFVLNVLVARHLYMVNVPVNRMNILKVKENVLNAMNLVLHAPDLNIKNVLVIVMLILLTLMTQIEKTFTISF